MKKRLLSLLAVAALTLTAMAQTWTAPVKPTSPAQGVEYQTDGTAYYLYNVGCGQFLTGANAWSTQLSLGTGGKPYLEFVVEDLTDYDAEDYPGCVKIRLNGGPYTVNGSNGERSFTDTYLYRDEESTGYIDFHDASSCWFWKFTQVEGTNNYYWQSAYNPETELTMNFPNAATQYAAGKGAGNAIALDGSIDDDNIEWAFVPVTSVDEAAMNAYSAQMDLYNTRVELYNLLNEAKNYTVDYAAALAVYNNANATIEQTQAAIDELQPKVTTAIVLAKIPESSEDNPLDITPYTIKNPDFENGMSPWTITEGMGQNLQVQSQSWSNGDIVIKNFIEAWRDNAPLDDGFISQEVIGLPKGRYRIEADVIANRHIGGDDELHGIYLFYNNGSYIVHSESLASNNWQPDHFSFDFDYVGTATMTIGLMAESTNCNWMGMDNFRLFAIGQCQDSPSWTALVTKYNTYIDYAENVKAEYVKIAELQSALESARSLVDAASDDSREAEYVAAMDRIDQARKVVEESEVAYKRLKDFVNKLNADQERYTGELLTLVEDLYEQWQAAYEDGTVTATDIDAGIDGYAQQLKQKTQELFDAAIAAGGNLQQPLDITALYDHMTFPDTNGSGQEAFAGGYPADEPVWMNETGTGNFKTNYGTAEVWDVRPFNIYRDFTNLPKGSYTIKTHAFFCVEYQDANYPNYNSGIYDPETEYAYLYAGINHTPLLNLAAIADPSFVNLDNPYDCGDGNYLPYNQHSAYMLFGEGNYPELNKQCYVAATGNVFEDGGTLRAGIAGTNNLMSNQWTIWYDFELYYNGVTSLDEDIKNLIEQLQEAELLGVLANKTLQANAIAAGTAAIGASFETQSAAIKTMQEALQEIAKTEILVEQLFNIMEGYDVLMAQFILSPTDEEFYFLKMQIDEALYNEDFESNEQIQGWMDALPNSWAKFVLSAAELTDATLDTPIDISSVIINNDFEMAGAVREVMPPYWTANGSIGEHQGYQDNNVYSNEDEDIALVQFLEAWNPNNAALSDGSLSQTIAAALPAGYYRLTVDGYATNEGNEDVPDGVFLFVNGAGAANCISLGCANSVPQAFTIDFAADGTGLTTVGIFVQSTPANWVAVDNFRLEYLGTTAPDGIKTLDNGQWTVDNATIYGIDGRQQSQLRRGINIVSKNGKVNKVLVK